MNTCFVEIALVNSSARLLKLRLTDNYAVFGAMKRYRGLELGEIKAADGIDDVPEKADSFRFGTRCGRALERFASGWDDRTVLACEAQIVRCFFAPLAESEKYSPEQKRETLLTELKSLVKRAQIRTHTAKPGYEDINTWISRYYRLQKEYREYLPRLVDAVVRPGPEELLLAERFLSREDALVSLALSGEDFSQAELEKALAGEQKSLFGKMLKSVLTEK